jgi:hypothetical protein
VPYLRLARGAARCHCDRSGDGETQCSKIQSGESPEWIKFAEPSSYSALQFYPSREQEWHIHLLSFCVQEIGFMRS